MKVVSVSGNTLTVEENGKQSQKNIAQNATVTINGNAGKLSDLQAGDTVSLSGNPATSVSATR